MDAADIPSDAPRPRLCHLRKRPDFDGYGFNLHAEKGRTGQFVGKVDHGSPAELAGLREGDRIVEVNGVGVGAETHAQVVERVKALPGETRFLVIDAVADEYYRERGITVRADMVGAHHHEESHGHHHDANGTESKHRPRLCHLKIWPDFTGYGFNLHAEKDKAIQYIGKVEVGSPAEAAGLREHDRIVEVNGFNVSTETHPDVVKRIKSDPKQVTLLVVDQEADEHFKKEGIVPTGHFPSVERIVCPDQSHGHKTAAKHGVVLYRPRLCHIKSRGDGKGYGFNLQAEKGKLGQFIGKVDPDSPADDAGLRDGDRLIEVNGINVEKESHKEVVERIKMIPNKTTMLVIDREGYDHYVAKGVVVTQALLDGDDSDHDHKHRYQETENGKSSHHGSDEDDREIEDLTDEIANIAKDAEKQDSFEHAEKKPALSLNVAAASGHGHGHGSSSSSTTSPLDSPKSPVVVGGIEFAGTAEEARKKMSKKRNVKETNMSVKAKYDLFQKL